MMFCNFSRNQRSIFVSSWMRSTVYPFFSACAMTKMRLSVGWVSAASMSSTSNSLFATKPCMPCPIIRRPFWITSSKLRPMAITSPTDFMLDPSSRETPLNLPRSQRGILQTI